MDEEIPADDDDKEKDRLDSCGEDALDEPQKVRLMNATAITGKMTKLGTRMVIVRTVDFTLAICKSPSPGEIRIPIGDALLFSEIGHRRFTTHAQRVGGQVPVCQNIRSKLPEMTRLV